MTKNPIFVEYYPHTQCDCYKVMNPWSAYKEHKIVLCRVSDGKEKASEIARQVLSVAMGDALNEEIKE